MPIEFKKTVAVCSDICSIDEAEALLSWSLDNPKGKINLKLCVQVHTAILQVLMATKMKVSALPEAQDLDQLLSSSGLLEK